MKARGGWPALLGVTLSFLGAVPLRAAAAEAGAPASGAVATAACERRSTKGRVVCEVEFEAPAGRIAWADVIVVRAPGFAPPLRSRVGIADARGRTARRVRIPVAFVATGPGRGEVKVRARATVCTAAEGTSETCVPVVREATAELVVAVDIAP